MIVILFQMVAPLKVRYPTLLVIFKTFSC